jgi:hypothetical protein
MENPHSRQLMYEALVLANAKSSPMALREAVIENVQKSVENRSDRLARLGEAFVSAENREHLKRLLVPCATDIESAANFCGLLARSYPQNADTILAMLRKVAE